MTTLSKDEIIAMAREADTTQGIYSESDYDEYLIRFAHLCRADLVAEIETLRYELDAIAEIKQERDALRADADHMRGILYQAGDVLTDERLVYNVYDSRKRDETIQEHEDRISDWIQRNEDVHTICEDIDNAMKRGEA